MNSWRSLSSRSRAAKAALFALVAAAGLTLAACGANGPKPTTQAPAQEEEQITVAPPTSLETPVAPQAYTSEIRIAILLPFSHRSRDGRAVASAIYNAAQMALFDTGNRNLVLLPKDTGSSTERAVAAAEQAIAEGAELILGPVFADDVRAVSNVTRLRGIPMIAFSTDTSVAGNGVFLLSFPPEEEVRRIVSFAAEQGRSKFAALLPATPYGQRVGPAFQSAVLESGGTIVGTASYPPKPDQMTPAVQSVAQSGFDAVLLAEGGTLLQALGPILPYNNVDPRSVKFLGTGLWDDPATSREPSLAGGWFAAPSPELRQRFLDRYSAIYDSRAARIASLGYDAMALANALSGGMRGQRFTNDTITDPNGFAGVDGIFRFRPDGHIERGLAVIEVGPAGFTVVSPAPTSFQGVGY